MRFIVDSLGIGIWKWNLDTNELDWDKNMYRLYGCDPKDFTGAYDAWESALSTETRAKAVEEISVAVKGGEPFNTTFQVVQKNTGRVQEIRTTAFLIRDACGRAIKMWGINLDRSIEAQLENELKCSTKFLEQTGALAKVGGWELDLKSGQVHMTKQTQILHEIDENYVPPKYSTGGEWYPPEVWPTVQAAVNKAIEHGTPYDLEAPFITAKMRKIWVRAQGFPVMEGGKVVKLQGTFQDISDRKKSEEILKRAMEDVERERIKAIRNAKLASLGEMSAGIAHEINNPLTIIYGTVRALPKFVNNPEQLAAKIEKIQSASERIAKIVSSLRKFSRTSDKSDYKLHSLSDIIKEAIVLTDAKAQSHSTKIEVDCQSECLVLCDEIEMEQVFVNLINNAVDAVNLLSEKWVRLQLNEVGGRVVIRIRDSGPRIGPEIQQKLFQPFFTTKPVGKGTGLGLSIVKGILDEHHATIELVADDPHTCFEICLSKAEGKKDEA
ncbi:MAG: PAS domain-containing protein [Proteobacteria bacterium]|nr:PAS domain-containing protein [Pseudomonadota bacterium]